ALWCCGVVRGGRRPFFLFGVVFLINRKKNGPISKQPTELIPSDVQPTDLAGDGRDQQERRPS
ncbi:hypothetical protein, partial [Promicromonospora sp. NPDC050249]|uniref:hypothetical protein n=1 Tax=Promicromonospora sp. NPDC050249 TaxID=3154743 RepID=UPI0033E5DD66